MLLLLIKHIINSKNQASHTLTETLPNPPLGSFDLCFFLEWRKGCLAQWEKVLSLSVSFSCSSPSCILSDLKERRAIMQLSENQTPTALWSYHLWHPDLLGWEMLSTPAVGWRLSQDGKANSNMARSTTTGFPCLSASYPQPCTRSQPHHNMIKLCQLARLHGSQSSNSNRLLCISIL